MNGDSPAVSVVVPCRNEKDHIEACVRSILNQESPTGGLEIIVADGMSDDGTRDVLKWLSEEAEEDHRLCLIDNPGRIVSTGLNVAIRAARGKIIIRMDAHTEYASDYVRQCVAVLRDSGADNVGGPARTRHAGYLQSAICAAYHSPFAVGAARFHDVAYEGFVDTVTYGCWQREVFEKMGLFDEELVRNQDDEFNLRLRRGGGKIWQSPRIKSWYSPRETLRALFLQYLQYGYWKVRVIQKHKMAASPRHLVPGCFALALIVLPPASVWWPAAGWGWLGLAGMYFACNVTASVLAARQRGWRLLPVLPLVFSCFHFAYGFGFLRGILDFLIMRRRPHHSFVDLTRTSGGYQAAGRTTDYH